MTNNRATLIEIHRNGDPYGGGYTGIQSEDGGTSWFYRGDIGARPRSWWRHYARTIDARLRKE